MYHYPTENGIPDITYLVGIDQFDVDHETGDPQGLPRRPDRTGACARCEIWSTLPHFAKKVALLSLFLRSRNELWISISGFESLGAANYFQLLPQISLVGSFPVGASLVRIGADLFRCPAGPLTRCLHLESDARRP